MQTFSVNYFCFYVKDLTGVDFYKVGLMRRGQLRLRDMFCIFYLHFCTFSFILFIFFTFYFFFVVVV